MKRVYTLIAVAWMLAGCAASHEEYASVAQAPLASHLTGQKLFQAKCAGCHVSGSAAPLDNPTAQMIQNAVLNVPQMASLNLTSDQVQSLADALDTKAPAVKFSAPANNSYIGSQLTLTGSCEDGIDVALNIGGMSTQAFCTGGAFTTIQDISSLPEGGLQITASQTDRAAHAASAALALTKDSVAPAVEFTAPAAAARFNAPAQTVSGTCETGIEVRLAGSALAAPNTASCAAGTFSSAVTFTGPNGTKAITLTQTDAAGNTRTVSRNVTVDFPTSAPAIALTQPAAGTSAKAGFATSSARALRLIATILC